MRIFLLFIALVAACIVTPVVATEVSAENGKKIFVKCGVCHSIEKDVSKVGPSLYQVLGRKAGTLVSFTLYSQAIRDSGVVWDEKTVAEFLKSPRAYIKGTRMIFVGLKSEKEIADLLAYLKSASE